jgi:death-on-curing family protein
MKSIKYPKPELIVRYNIIALSVFKVKRQDRPEVMSKAKISQIIEECKKLKGDVYDKAAFMMKSLVQRHPFASGNRRTAFIATAAFVDDNGAVFGIKNDPSYSKTMTGIRENFYKDEEIQQWIRTGEIREFERGAGQ